MIKYLNLDCISLENDVISLLVTQSVGPRIISLRFRGSTNLLAELPDFVTVRPDGETFHYYGGHRLWHAPENMPRTYTPDDDPVYLNFEKSGVRVTGLVEQGTGIEKSMKISLVDDKPQIVIRHTLTNRNLWPVECAPWAITQLRTGGVAILPQSQEQTEVLPNRSVVLWPYTDLGSPQVAWGNRYILVCADMESPFKIGFPNPRGWLAYWIDGILFVKRASFDGMAEYYDFGSSSECYCNSQFLELETLAPISKLNPGESALHTETWEFYAGVAYPEKEDLVQRIVETLELE